MSSDDAKVPKIKDIKKKFYALAKNTSKTIDKYKDLGKLLHYVLGKNCTHQDIVFAEMALPHEKVTLQKLSLSIIILRRCYTGTCF